MEYNDIIYEESRWSFTVKLAAFFHIAGYLALLHGNILLSMKTMISENCTGISKKSQLLFATAHVGQFISILHNRQSSIDIFFGFVVLMYSAVILSWICIFQKQTYQRQYDNFRMIHVILPCIFLTTLACYACDPEDTLKTFSDYLEAMAMIPQLYFIMKAREIEINVYHFIVLLTTYKSLHVIVDILENCNNTASLAAGIGSMIPNLYFFLAIASRRKDACMYLSTNVAVS